MAKIPQPKSKMIVKNLLEIDIQNPMQSLTKLAEEFGGIYRLEVPSSSFIVVSDPDLAKELCDEKRFHKEIYETLDKLRDLGGDGLATAHNYEPNWAKAHRILTPAFGPLSIRNMFDNMYDVAEQMILKWERLGDDYEIDTVDFFTKLTLDIIALCAFNYRFNSFYQKEMHPFVDAMTGVIKEITFYVKRLPIQNKLMIKTKNRYKAQLRYLNVVSQKIIDQRNSLAKEQWPNDLLSLMLNGKDPLTGEGLSDKNITYQMVTFLLAGHETTSGLLSFAIHELLNNPPILQKAYQVVDEVLGNSKPTVQHLSKLTYLEQILKETLRLFPLAPALSLKPYEDTTIGGKYQISKDDNFLLLLPTLHRSTSVWGEDADKFCPERFSDEKISDIPSYAYRPFGNGQRSCIGRPFAMQESVLVLAMILQRFELHKFDQDYKLSIKESITLKPNNFMIKVKPRSKRSSLAQNQPTAMKQAISQTTSEVAKIQEQEFLILYGSNSGSSLAFAQQLYEEILRRGRIATLGQLNAHINDLATTKCLIIVTASYEGQPTHDAVEFVNWLKANPECRLDSLKYCIFGCGNSDWTQTYQFVPKLIEAKLEQLGATKMIARGESDAKQDFFGAFERWSERLWAAFGSDSSKEKPIGEFKIKVVEDNRKTLFANHNLVTGTVLQNYELAKSINTQIKSKRHLEIALSGGVSYQAGDYLFVLPKNNPAIVTNLLKRFNYSVNDKIIIESETPNKPFPLNVPLSVYELVANYFELNSLVTQKQLAILAKFTVCPPEKIQIASLIEDNNYHEHVVLKRLRIYDILWSYQSCELPFERFMEITPLLKPRQYSISSSSLVNQTQCSLTVSVLNEPSYSGMGNYLGATSNYLASSQVGDKLLISIMKAHDGFYLPDDLSQPIIMIAAGTGLAPFRGFLQERAMLQKQGKSLGEAYLFFGCRSPDDYLYQEEITQYIEEGWLNVRVAFSRCEQNGIKYVQDYVWAERAEVVRLFLNQSGKIYVCGDGKNMEPAIKNTLMQIYREQTAETDIAAKTWMYDIEYQQKRYSKDIFST